MTEAEQRAILQAAARDPALVALVPPVVALGFGVLALRRLGDVLTVACAPDAPRPALRMLRAVLRLEIVATPFDPRLLRDAVREAYAEGEQVNFPTFQERAFLEREENAELLRREKVEDLGPVACDLAPDRVALAELAFRTRLISLDRPQPPGALPDPRATRLELGSLEQVWRAEGGGHTAWLPGGQLPPRARLLVNEVRRSEHLNLPGRRLEEQEARGLCVETLPFVLHPTEVQLTGIEADGTLLVHAYDHQERFPPGAARAVRLVYQFLSWGERLERTIELRVEAVRTVSRAALTVRAGPMPWGPRELARWLGVDPPVLRSGADAL